MQIKLKGKEGFQATYELLQNAAKANDKPVFYKSGLIRIALTSTALTEYNLCAEFFSDVRKLTNEEVKNLVPGAVDRPGIFIDSALTIYTDAYLQGLWNLCRKGGSILEQASIESLDELKGYDLVIVTAGSASMHIRELSELPLTPIKGQLLEN